MARRRYQNPKLRKHHGWWTIVLRKDCFQDGKHKRPQVRVRLARLSEASKRKAEKLKDEYLRPLNASLSAVGSLRSFKTFVGDTYVPLELSNWAITTRQRYQGVIDNYLMPAFGSFALGDLTPAVIQGYFTGLSSTTLSHESMDKIRVYWRPSCEKAPSRSTN